VLQAMLTFDGELQLVEVDNVQFFQAASNVVACLSDQPHEECTSFIEQCFHEEISILSDARACLATEKMLIGHVTLLTSLWRFLVVNTPSKEETLTALPHPANVSMLIELLFPEALIFTESRGSGWTVSSAQELNDALVPLCITQEARKAVYKLLREVVSHSAEMMQACLLELLEMLEAGPQSHAVLKQQFAENFLRTAAEDVGICVHSRRGLQNGGATCYMNAIFQQLYMQPTIRALVLHSPLPPRESVEDSVFFQIQRMFAHLALSNARSFTPSGIWNSLKDVEGQPINVMVRLSTPLALRLS
jgi:hypothetical protein